MRTSRAYVGKNGWTTFSTSGRLVEEGRATYEAALGVPDPFIPQLSDLKAERVKPDDVDNYLPHS